MAMKLERNGKKMSAYKSEELVKFINKDNKKRNSKIRKELAARNYVIETVV